MGRLLVLNHANTEIENYDRLTPVGLLDPSQSTYQEWIHLLNSVHVQINDIENNTVNLVKH